MKIQYLLSAALILLILPQLLHAQGFATGAAYAPTDGSQPVVSTGDGSGSYADCMRAYGEMVFNKAQAAEHFQAARQQRIANQAEAVRQWWGRHDEYRARQEQESAARRRARQQKAVLARAVSTPHPVTQSESRADGQIQWPVALLAEAHAESRQRLEQIYRYGNSEVIAQLADTLANQLRSRIHELPTPEYMKAQHFLRTLKQGPAVEAPSVRTVNRTVHKAVGVSRREG